MLHVRIVSDFPADPIFGLPPETVDLTLTLPEAFAADAAEAHAKIQAGAIFEIPSADPEPSFRFTPGLIREVVVWRERPDRTD